jgi:hypothetical protein
VLLGHDRSVLNRALSFQSIFLKPKSFRPHLC